MVVIRWAILTFAAMWLLSTATGMAGDCASAVEKAAPRLAVITTADLQSCIASRKDAPGGMDRVAVLADQVRSQVDGALLVSTGDDLMGAFYAVFKGVPEVEAMNMAGYDVVVPGNHEFDQGVATYAGAAARARFDIVAANLDVSGTGLEGIIKPGVLKSVGGVTVGVFGLITPALKSVCNVGDDVQVDPDLAGVATRMVASLRSQGAQLVIALSHCGTVLDQELAARTPGLDLIVGGHSHEYRYETVIRPDNQPCVLVQAGAGGSRAGVLRFSFMKSLHNPQWALKDLDGTLGSDQRVKTCVDAYMDRFDALLAHPIGETMVALDSRKEVVRGGESNLGNLITDAVAQWFGSEAGEPGLVMANGGGIRGDRVFPAGKLSRKDVLTILPFSNTMVKVEMTGAQMQAVLEASASALQVEGDGCNLENRVSSGGFLQVSQRFRIHIDPLRDPFCARYQGRAVVEIYNPGHRIRKIEILTHDQWQPLVPDQIYTVYVNSWVASGGDGNYLFPDLKQIDSTVQTSDILAWYIQQNSPVNPVVQDRIVFDHALACLKGI